MLSLSYSSYPWNIKSEDIDLETNSKNTYPFLKSKSFFKHNLDLYIIWLLIKIFNYYKMVIVLT